MVWLLNRKFRSLTDRATVKLAAELGDEAKSKTLALAVGHACCPSGTYGDGDRMDAMLETIRRVATTPCDSATAQMLLKQWEAKAISSNEFFKQVWGMEIEVFVARIVKRIEA